MSLLGCESARDSLKTWNTMTLSATFSASSTVTDVVSDPPVVYTKIWNSGNEFLADKTWTRAHPSDLQIADDYPAEDKFWVTSRCCCWVCRFQLLIKSFDSDNPTPTIGTSPTEVSFRVPWVEYIDGVQDLTGTDQIYCRISPVNDITSPLAYTSYYCNEPESATRTPIKYKVVWTNNGVPWSFGGGGDGTSTRTYTGSDGGTGTGAWDQLGLSLTEGSGLGNNDLEQMDCCTSEQQLFYGRLVWAVNKTSNAGYDYDSVFSGDLKVQIELE